MVDIEVVKNEIKNRLSEDRYIHSLGVMEECEKLAKLYNVNEEEARLVGISHDIAKEMKLEEYLEYATQNKIQIDRIEIEIPSILHGKIGADIVKKKYNFTEEMCKAICYHTTGVENMSNLAKILYVSDKIEKNRKEENYNIERARKLAEEDINKAIIFLLEEGIKLNIDRKKLLHPNSILARNYLIKEI